MLLRRGFRNAGPQSSDVQRTNRSLRLVEQQDPQDDLVFSWEESR